MVDDIINVDEIITFGNTKLIPAYFNLTVARDKILDEVDALNGNQCFTILDGFKFYLMKEL